MEINYLPLFLIFIIAWVVPLVLSWLEIGKVPSVIVEIVLGVLIGPFVLNLVEKAEYLDFLANTGFLFLIFLAGLEIDVNKILTSFPKGKIKGIDLASNSLLLALFIYFGSLLISWPFAWLANQFIEIDILFFTLLFPTVALSIIAPILKAEGAFKRKFGQVILMEGAIATVMSIILISVYSGVLKNGFELELLLFLSIFAAFFINYFLGRKLIKVRTFQKLLYRLEHAASQIKVRGTVAILLLFVFIAQLIETELALGAFFAGTLMSMFVTKRRSALLFKLDGMSYGFFIPIFFIMVGVNLELSALTQFGESIPFILTLTVGFFITQVVPALVMARVFGWKKALSGGILLTARLGLTIAAAKIGLSLEVITPADNAGIVTAAIITSLVAPLLYKLFNKEVEDFHDVIILGGSRASLLLAERFKMHGVSCVTLLHKKDIATEFDLKGVSYRKVEQLDKTLLDKIELRTTDLMVVLTESRPLNNELTRYIKNELQHNKIIARRQAASHDLIDTEGELKFVDTDELLANHIEDLVLRPDSVGQLASSFDEYRIEEILVTKQEVNGKQVKEIAFPPQGSLVIHSRGGEIFIPHGDTHILTGDVITVIGNSAALQTFREIFE